MHIGLIFYTVLVPRIWFQMSGKVGAIVYPEHLYETTPKWHGFLMIKLAASAAGLNSEPQPATSPSVVSSELKNSGSNDSAVSNIEYRISKDGSAVRCLFIIDRIHSFAVRCWTFDVRRSSVSFSIRLAVFCPAGGLTPET